MMLHIVGPCSFGQEDIRKLHINKLLFDPLSTRGQPRHHSC